jgi:hypothetical protein
MMVFTGCIEEFEPPARGYENLLVVEGYLADNSHESEVRLSRSIPLDTIGQNPETGAIVSIADDSGEIIQFSEVKDGIYKTQVNNSIKTGKAYQLRIIARNDVKYESDWVIMRTTPPIDSLIWRYEEKPELGIKGVQIYVNTHDPENNTWYYRWYWEETWIFHTAYYSDIYWDNNQIKRREEQIYSCWKSTSSTSINIATSKTLDRDIIYNFPILYVANNSDRLRERYSLNVKQYSLSEESYNYWKELENVTENLGTLFDPLPSTLEGNIHNVNNENEKVLGYFDAATVQEQRIFVDNIDLPYMRYVNYYENCQDTIVSYGLIGEMILRGFELARPVPGTFGYDYLMADPFCIDCRRAGTNVKPDFW